MLEKTVLVNKPIHIVALERLQEEVSVLTPYTASSNQVLELLPQVHGVILGAASPWALPRWTGLRTWR